MSFILRFLPSGAVSLLLLALSANALPTPGLSAPAAPATLILCLSVVPSSLVVLLVAKVLYMKNRRINYIHTLSSAHKTHFSFLVGMFGSPDWEVNMTRGIAEIHLRDKLLSSSHSPIFGSGLDTFASLDEFGKSLATRRIDTGSGPPLPSLPALAHIPPCFENYSGISLPLPTTDSSPRSFNSSARESPKIRLVSEPSQSSLDSISFISAASKFSSSSKVIHQQSIATPSKVKTKRFYRKTPPMPFLPIQTPPASPPFGHGSHLMQTAVSSLENDTVPPPVVVQHIPHPYAEYHTLYDFPRSPHSSYGSPRSPVFFTESPVNSKRSSKSPLMTCTRTNIISQINSPFFSSVSSKAPLLCSPPANIKLIPFCSTGVGKIVPESHDRIPAYAYGATPSIPCEFLSSMESGSYPGAVPNGALVLNNQRDLRLSTRGEKTKFTGSNGDTKERGISHASAALFSIPEEEMQSRSSKSYSRLSCANSATWRNSGNLNFTDLEITVTTLPESAARRDFPCQVDSAAVDNRLCVDDADDGEEESRACLIGLLEELEEWGCEWVDNKELPNGQ